MKKNIFILLGIAIFGILLWAGNFYWRNLRGSGPAFRPPPADIAKIIEESQKRERPSINTTGFPLKLPPGFSISIFAKELTAPRVMIWDSEKTMLVSITGEGKIVALPDKDGNGVADEVRNVVVGLKKPHGLAMKCKMSCTLYVAETDKVLAYDYDPKSFTVSNRRKVIALPGGGGGHFTRTILFLPPPEEDRILISVGSTCNVCEEHDWRRAKVLVVREDGGDLEVFASGLRNAVFMASHPESHKVWVTEMGRDLLGDDTPPDEINIIEKGKNYGWPICYGKNVHDTDFDKNVYVRPPCTEPFETPSYIDIPAHSAPLGLAFIPKGVWPEDYTDDLLVVYHGSWNRTVPTGYKVVRFLLDRRGNYLGEKDFISGWLTDEGALGRPADLLFSNDGKLFISDDKAGVIYLITR